MLKRKIDYYKKITLLAEKVGNTAILCYLDSTQANSHQITIR
jgi:hypothetical protein